MKKTMLLGLSVLMMGLLSTACIDSLSPIDQTREEKPAIEGLYTITATLESDATKTQLDGMNVVWQSGDEIKIFDASHTSGVVYTLASGEGTTTGTFTGGALSDAGPYYAIYPASAISGALTTNLSVTAPMTQAYTAGTFAKGVNLAVAKGADKDNLAFRNAGGLLKLQVTGNKSIKAINLYSLKDEPFNGILTVSDLTAETPTFTYTGSGEDKSKLSLSFASPVALSGTATDFYFFLPPGTLASGFVAELIDSEGNAMLKSTTNDNSIARSSVREMPAFAYDPQYRAAFLTDASLSSAWTAVMANDSESKQASTTTTAGQYALVARSDDHTVRIQDWSIGYVLSITVPNSFTLNSTYSSTVSILGTVAGITTGSPTLKMIKKHGSRIWLVNETSNDGFVVR